MSEAGWEPLLESTRHTATTVCVCRFAHTRMRAHTHGLRRKIKTKWGRWGGFLGTHIMTSPACALLTLPFALVAGEASGGGGVVSLGLRRRPFSWPLTPSEEPSLASARFLARSVFHDRDFLYGTGTRNINRPIREKLSGVQLGLAAEATWLSGLSQNPLYQVWCIHFYSAQLLICSCLVAFLLYLYLCEWNIKPWHIWSSS